MRLSAVARETGYKLGQACARERKQQEMMTAMVRPACELTARLFASSTVWECATAMVSSADEPRINSLSAHFGHEKWFSFSDSPEGGDVPERTHAAHTGFTVSIAEITFHTSSSPLCCFIYNSH